MAGGGNRGKGYKGGAKGKGYHKGKGYEGDHKGKAKGAGKGGVWRAKGTAKEQGATYSTQNKQCHRHRVAHFYPHESLTTHQIIATDMWISGEPSRARSLAACWRVRA